MCVTVCPRSLFACTNIKMIPEMLPSCCSVNPVIPHFMYILITVAKNNPGC